ncbi:MAG: LysR family transcriptional regulator [Myxococcales bacterium]|nr:LysR family transcriptional regulator [Myxococcales bacterium]
MDWDDLRYFLAAVRAGSLTAAATQLGVNQSTVSRRIRALEDELGTPLFVRGARGLVQSEAAAAVLLHAERVEAEVGLLSRRASGRDLELEGTVRIATADVLAECLIEPLHSFAQRHPRIDLEVFAANEVRSLDRNEADLSVRGSPGPPGSAVGRRICEIWGAQYVAEGTSPSRWIGWSGFMRRLDVTPDDVPVMARFDSARLQARAVASGLGRCILPCFVGDRTPGIERVPGTLAATTSALWVLTHADLRRSARVRALLQHLAGALREQAPLFEGQAPHRLDVR